MQQCMDTTKVSIILHNLESTPMETTTNNKSLENIFDKVVNSSALDQTLSRSKKVIYPTTKFPKLGNKILKHVARRENHVPFVKTNSISEIASRK